jgi:hypothetical protein
VNGERARARDGSAARRGTVRRGPMSERGGGHRRGAWTVQRIGEGTGDGTCYTARGRKARGGWGRVRMTGRELR